MNKTKIEWCDRTWNPVTGCFHNCPYCYAAKIAKRFGGDYCYDSNGNDPPLFVLNEPYYTKRSLGAKPRTNPYPYSFSPTFHRYRLEEPSKTKKPQNIFVCSMADLFGDWVPDEWIIKIIEACKNASQHRYLFLTKNYKRYEDLTAKKILPCLREPYYFGSTITTQEESKAYFDWHFNSHNDYKNNYWINRFISAEPLQGDINLHLRWFTADWVIIGAETGNRKNKVIPKREWIENIVHQCHAEGGHRYVRVFMKDSLAEIWNKPLIQEYPWNKESL